jgi:hypothetical protein
MFQYLYGLKTRRKFYEVAHTVQAKSSMTLLKVFIAILKWSCPVKNGKIFVFFSINLKGVVLGFFKA